MINNDDILDIIEYLKRDIYQYCISSKPEVLSEEEKDIKISADKELNKRIVTFLEGNFRYPILSEESENNLVYGKYDDHIWIIDPLDGSMNYSRGIPIYCISIALWEKDTPVVGIIFDIERNELYYTHDNCTKAFMNEKEISTSKTESREKGIICTGFPSWRNYDKESLMNFVKKVQSWKKVRLLGSAAVSLAWVAAGRADAYLEEDIRIWDVAAGIALVKAAGGRINVFKRDRDNFVTAFAWNGKILDEENT